MEHAKKPTIALHPVKSSMFKAHGYDPASRTLAVQFSNGDTWHYPDVSPEAAASFAQADSLGSHFARHIRGKHTGTKQ
jgi:hypothetical protein